MQEEGMVIPRDVAGEGAERLLGRIEAMGLHGLDARALATDLLSRGFSGSGEEISPLDLRCAIRNLRRAEKRVHEREKVAARRRREDQGEAPPEVHGEAREVRRLLSDALREVFVLEDEDARAAFAGAVLKARSMTGGREGKGREEGPLTG
jgi:hypothetical protein